MNRSDLNTVMSRYILGQLSPEERARLEEEYFANADVFEEMVAAENDLIDAYVAGRLQGNDLRQFENHFLCSPERHQRVAFARSLVDSKSQGELPSSSPVQQTIASRWPISPSWVSRSAVAFIFLLLLASGIWLVVRNIRLGRELADVRTFQARLEQEEKDLQERNSELMAELAQHQIFPAQEALPLGPSGQSALLLTLSADLTRGHGKPNVLPLFSRISSVVLVLETKRDLYSGYQISLETPDGTTVLQKKELKSWMTTDGVRVAVPLPPSALQHGDYVLRLMAIGSDQQIREVDDYSFRVVNR